MTRSPQSAMRGRYDRKMERTPGHLRRVCCELDPLFWAPTDWRSPERLTYAATTGFVQQKPIKAIRR